MRDAVGNLLAQIPFLAEFHPAFRFREQFDAQGKNTHSFLQGRADLVFKLKLTSEGKISIKARCITGAAEADLEWANLVGRYPKKAENSFDCRQLNLNLGLTQKITTSIGFLPAKEDKKPKVNADALVELTEVVFSLLKLAPAAPPQVMPDSRPTAKAFSEHFQKAMGKTDMDVSYVATLKTPTEKPLLITPTFMVDPVPVSMDFTLRNPDKIKGN